MLYLVSTESPRRKKAKIVGSSCESYTNFNRTIWIALIEVTPQTETEPMGIRPDTKGRIYCLNPRSIWLQIAQEALHVYQINFQKSLCISGHYLFTKMTEQSRSQHPFDLLQERRMLGTHDPSNLWWLVWGNNSSQPLLLCRDCITCSRAGNGSVPEPSQFAALKLLISCRIITDNWRGGL